jgi:hypothetical protein
MQLAQRHRHVITLVAAALVLHRIRDHDRVHDAARDTRPARAQVGELLLSQAIQLPPVHASDAELNSDILSAHPLFRRRRPLISVGVDAS